MVLELQRAERMRDAFDRVGLAVGEIITRVDRPLRAGARMARMQDAVEHRVAQVDVAGRHVDLGAQHARAVGELAGLHAAEQIEVFLDAAFAERRVLPRLGQRAARETHLVLGLVVHIGLAGADQLLGPAIEPLEIVRRVIEVLAPVKAKPANVFLNRFYILNLLLGGIGIIEPQVTHAVVFGGDAKIEADRLGVANMQMPIRLRRKSRHHPPAVLAGLQVCGDDLANKIRRGGSLGCSQADGFVLVSF